MNTDSERSTQGLPRGRLATVRRWLGRGLLVLLGAVVLFYVLFLAFMKVTEQRWLVSAPFHPAIDVTSEEPHEFTLLDRGVDALAMRLALIKGAQRSLDLEYFIYDLDASSRIVARALAQRARAGVKVRILVDFSVAVFQLRPQYAAELAAAGVEVRYYNTASVARLFSVQHRTHRKILIADADTAMVGGRNIADDYFDLSSHYNFLDSDTLVRGPVVSAMQQSFDLYWDSPWAQASEAMEIDGAQADVRLLAPLRADTELLAKVESRPLDMPSHQCPKTRFVTDYPGVGLQNRRVYAAITEVLGEASSTVVAESPYFVLREDGVQALASLTDRGVDVTVLTNSLHSTDAYYTVSPLYFALHDLAQPHFQLFAYSGSKPQVAKQFPGSFRWGVHSKRAVVDDNTIMIGTYNIDPRSANLNSELIVVCQGSVALASQMRDDMQSRIAQAALVIDETTVDSSKLLGAASWRSLLLMGVVTPVASLFNFLL